MILWSFAWADGGERDYARAVAEATVVQRVYDGWYTALLVRGTRVDDALLAAQARRVDDVTGGAGTVPSLNTIVLAVSGQFKDELRFAADGSTPWTAQVSSGGTPCGGLVVTEVKKPSPLQFALYPHLTSWDKLVVLAPGDCPGGVADTLLLISARGRAELRWAPP